MSSVATAPAGLERLVLDAFSVNGAAAERAAAGMDQLELTCAPLVPEVRLLLADDAIVLWARLEAEAGHDLPAPYWASAWAGGQALARYVLDHPATVAGRSVLDIASGSGMVAIAAAMAGARVVVANDIDPYAIAALTANAEANGVRLVPSSRDLLDGDFDGVGDPDRGDLHGGVEVVLAGDALYHPAVAARVLPFLARVVRRGGRVLVGDPDRGHLPHDWLRPVATYRVPMTSAPEDTQLNLTSVLEARPGPGPGRGGLVESGSTRPVATLADRAGSGRRSRPWGPSRACLAEASGQPGSGEDRPEWWWRLPEPCSRS